RVVSSGCIHPQRSTSSSHVKAAYGIARERAATYCRVLACRIICQCTVTDGCVCKADDIVLQRIDADGRVAETGFVVLERLNTVGRVAAAGGVNKERKCTSGGVPAFAVLSLPSVLVRSASKPIAVF